MSCDGTMIGLPFAGLRMLLVDIIRTRASSCASDRKSTRLNSSHVRISYAVFCLKKKKIQTRENGVQFIHVSPRDPTREDDMPRDSMPEKRKMNEIFDCLEDYSLCGQTHTLSTFT